MQPSTDPITLKNFTGSFYPLEEIDSTNSEVKRKLTEDVPSPIIVISKKQTAGRGRFNKNWHSNSPENLYLSLGFCPTAPIPDLSLFTLWMGTAICKKLNEIYCLQLKIKWPNDLYFNNNKLAGMLTESQLSKQRVKHLIFGIGLNINSTPPIDNTTSLKEILQNSLDYKEVSTHIINCILTAYEEFATGSFVNSFQEQWGKLDFLYKKNIEVNLNALSFKGIAQGITEDGALIIKNNNESKNIHSGTIKIV